MCYYSKSNNKKKDFFGFDSVKMHCGFLDVTNAFQMRFDELSNSKGIKEIEKIYKRNMLI